MRTRIIAVSNQKGGVGKTTTSVNLAHGLALRGHRVLLVDLDAQGNCAPALGVTYERTTYDLLIEKLPPEECLVQARENLWLLPSDASMAEVKDRIVAEAAVDAVASFSSRRRRETQSPALVLANAMRNLSGFDYCLLDAAPGLDIMSANALMYAQEVLMPVSVDFLATIGAGQHVQSVVDAQQQGSDVYISTVLPTFYDSRTNKARYILQELTHHFAELVAEPIPKNVRLAESFSYGETIWEYDQRSIGGQAYAQLVERIAHA